MSALHKKFVAEEIHGICKSVLAWLAASLYNEMTAMADYNPGGNYDRTVSDIGWKYTALDSGTRKSGMADANRESGDKAWKHRIYLDHTVFVSAVLQENKKGGGGRTSGTCTVSSD